MRYLAAPESPALSKILYTYVSVSLLSLYIDMCITGIAQAQ